MSIRDNFLFENAELLNCDPSEGFIISHDNKIGSGGFGKIFKVKRRRDEKPCALKFCTPSNSKERNMLINEIGLMKQCREAEAVVRVLASYEFKERIWIFLELMDDDLTGFLESYH